MDIPQTSSKKLALESLGWPEHDPAVWRDLAQTAATVVRDGVLRGQSSFPGTAAASPSIDSVASCRAAEALLYFVDAAPGGWISEATKDAATKIADMASEVDEDAFLAGSRGEIRLGGNEFQPLAVAALVSLQARLALLEPKPAASVSPKLVERLLAFVSAIVESAKHRDGLDAVHPLAIYYAARALWLAEYSYRPSDEIANARPAFADVVRALTEQLTARVALGRRNPSESVALAFCAASAPLVGFSGPGYVLEPLGQVARVQTAEGIWSEGNSATPLVDPDSGGELTISTHEIAWAIAEALLGMTEKPSSGPHELPPGLLAALSRSAAHAQASSVDLKEDGGALTGWPTHYRYAERSFDLLPTSMVLLLAVSLRRLRHRTEHAAALRALSVEDPENEFWPTWLEWDSYRQTSEPDSRVGILGYINRELVEPALTSRDQPPWRRVTARSALLFGPPGTTKTTIVRAVAQGVQWPLVTLSPGNFVEDGLEMVEAKAALVFDRLHALSRAVVLFDECDELFRDRHPELPTDQTRGIAAFITASMLPKLQDLHDRGQILLFVLTNHFATMDAAIKRLGRMDHIIGIGPADETQRLATIKREVDVSGGGYLEDAAKELARICVRFNRSEIVRAAQGLKPYADAAIGDTFASEKEAKEWANGEYERLRNACAISEAQAELFEEQAAQQSGPHIAAAGMKKKA